MSSSSGFRANFNFFGCIVENADADVVELEILLNVSNDFCEHLLAVLAGDRRFGDIVKKGKLPGPTLLFAEEDGVLDGHGDLPGSGFQHIQIALLEYMLLPGAQGDHHSRGSSVHHDGHA